MRKLKTGGAITLKKKNFVEDSPYRIRVMPNTSRRIQTAMRKDSGVRINLKPEEDIYTMTEGGKVSLKSIGRSIKKGFTKGADVVKKGFQKEIIDSGVGKEIAKNLINVGTDVVLPAALTGLSMMAGDPTGLSGQAAANVAGKYIHQGADKGGYGVFKTLSKIGISKKAVKRAAKDIGKVALREGAKAAGEALTAYTGNPMAGKALERVAVKGGDKLIDTGSAKKALGESAKSAKRFAAEVVDDYIDENLSGAEKKIAQKALAGKYPSAKDLVYDYGSSKLEEMDVPDVPLMLSGYGVPRRTRGGLRMGKGSPYLTRAYAVGMRSATEGAGAGFRVADDRVVTPATAPSSIIQTGSPFQRINSPAMSPFISGSPQLAKPIRPTSGGSFLPAGRSGRGVMGMGFMPAG